MWVVKRRIARVKALRAATAVAVSLGGGCADSTGLLTSEISVAADGAGHDGGLLDRDGSTGGTRPGSGPRAVGGGRGGADVSDSGDSDSDQAADGTGGDTQAPVDAAAGSEAGPTGGDALVASDAHRPKCKSVQGDFKTYMACCERVNWSWDEGCMAWGPPAPPAMLDLTKQVADLDITDLPALDAAERSAALATWRGRMHNEYVSARVFEALAGQAAAAGLTEARQTMVASFAEDERRHGRLCAAVVVALGGEPEIERLPLADVPAHADCEPLEALLRNVLSVSCLAETVAVSLITAEREKTGPESLQGLLRSILADEVRHARFGWTLLDEVGARLDARTKGRLNTWLRLAFAHLEVHELRFLAAGHAPSQIAEQVGVCGGDEARELFYETVTEVIIPGLARRGLDAATAWDTRTMALAA